MVFSRESNTRLVGKSATPLIILWKKCADTYREIPEILFHVLLTGCCDGGWGVGVTDDSSGTGVFTGAVTFRE